MHGGPQACDQVCIQRHLPEPVQEVAAERPSDAADCDCQRHECRGGRGACRDAVRAREDPAAGRQLETQWPTGGAALAGARPGRCRTVHGARVDGLAPRRVERGLLRRDLPSAGAVARGQDQDAQDGERPRRGHDRGHGGLAAQHAVRRGQVARAGRARPAQPAVRLGVAGRPARVPRGGLRRALQGLRAQGATSRARRRHHARRLLRLHVALREVALRLRARGTVVCSAGPAKARGASMRLCKGHSDEQC